MCTYLFPALLLTNYRCHDSILRLPSNLFFESTLKVRTDSKLHPKTSSALEFVCTSMDNSVVISTKDYSEEEATITLEQVNPMNVMLGKTITMVYFRCNIMLILGQLHNGERKICQLFV